MVETTKMELLLLAGAGLAVLLLKQGKPQLTAQQLQAIEDAKAKALAEAQAKANAQQAAGLVNTVIGIGSTAAPVIASLVGGGTAVAAPVAASTGAVSAGTVTTSSGGASAASVVGVAGGTVAGVATGAVVVVASWLVLIVAAVVFALITGAVARQRRRIGYVLAPLASSNIAFHEGKALFNAYEANVLYQSLLRRGYKPAMQTMFWRDLMSPDQQWYSDFHMVRVSDVDEETLFRLAKNARAEAYLWLTTRNFIFNNFLTKFGNIAEAAHVIDHISWQVRPDDLRPLLTRIPSPLFGFNILETFTDYTRFHSNGVEAIRFNVGSGPDQMAGEVDSDAWGRSVCVATSDVIKTLNTFALHFPQEEWAEALQPWGKFLPFGQGAFRLTHADWKWVGKAGNEEDAYLNLYGGDDANPVWSYVDVSSQYRSAPSITKESLRSANLYSGDKIAVASYDVSSFKIFGA
jgi:hypothetical protein